MCFALESVAEALFTARKELRYNIYDSLLPMHTSEVFLGEEKSLPSIQGACLS